jgi:hypothetical protein
MKPVVIIISILVIIACLGFGFYLGDLTTPSSSISLTQTSQPMQMTKVGNEIKKSPTNQSFPPPVNPNQHNLIFIQADDLKKSSPRLESIWLAGYISGSADITFILVYPSSQTGTFSSIAQIVSTSFKIDSNGTVSDGFISSLKSFGFYSNGYVLSDIKGLAQYVDWLGGIDINDGAGIRNGDVIVTKLVPPWQDIQKSRLIQQTINQGICSQLEQISFNSNWFTLISSLIPDHFHTDLSLEYVTQEWKQLFSGSDKLSCQVVMP